MGVTFLEESETFNLSLDIPAWKIAAIEDKVEETLEILEQAYSTDLISPSLLYDLTGRVAGRARKRAGKYTVRLNRDLINSKDWSEFLSQTVPHEVAHIAQYQLFPGSKGHGPEWKMLMRQIGLEPHRCHQFETKRARSHTRPYAYECGCEKPHMLTKTRHNRIVKGTVYICPKCDHLIANINYIGEKNV